jgi:hypothetical protein
MAPRSGAGLVLHDHGRVAGNVGGEVPGDSARVDIVARADADADHDAHRFAAIEVGDILLRQRRSGEYDGQRQQGDLHWLSPVAFAPSIP